MQLSALEALLSFSVPQFIPSVLWYLSTWDTHPFLDKFAYFCPLILIYYNLQHNVSATLSAN